MKVNGNITLSEGGVVNNLTLPRGTAFPANANVGEKFRLTTAIDANTPAGEYSHDGTSWHNQPTLEEVKTLVSNAGGAVAYYRIIGEARTGFGTQAAGHYIFTNAGANALTAGTGIVNFSASITVPFLWIDPADYPVGTKFRLRAQIYSNIATVSDFVISLRKVTRTAASQSNGSSLSFTVDLTNQIGPVSFTGGQASGVIRTGVSADFTMLATADLYCLAFVQTNTMTANSACLIEAQIQAKY
jgi:hypothetical protein